MLDRLGWLREPGVRANWLLMVLAAPLGGYLLFHWLLPGEGLGAAATLPLLGWILNFSCQAGYWGERLLRPLAPLVPFLMLGKPALGQLAALRLQARHGLADPVRYETVYRLVDRLAAAMGVPAPPVVVAPGRWRACLCGVYRPVLVLSPRTLASLTAAELAAVLAHELAHLQRRDHLLRPLAGALRGMMFFLPLAHRLLALLELEQEKAADDLAVAVTGDRLLYGATLLKAWRLMNGEAVRPVMAGVAVRFAGTAGSLALRVERLLADPAEARPRSGRAMGSYALLVLSVGALLLLSC